MTSPFCPCGAWISVEVRGQRQACLGWRPSPTLDKSLGLSESLFPVL